MGRYEPMPRCYSPRPFPWRTPVWMWQPLTRACRGSWTRCLYVSLPHLLLLQPFQRLRFAEFIFRACLETWFTMLWLVTGGQLLCLLHCLYFRCVYPGFKPACCVRSHILLFLFMIVKGYLSGSNFLTDIIEVALLCHCTVLFVCFQMVLHIQIEAHQLKPSFFTQRTPSHFTRSCVLSPKTL